jgi:hypothetical protein
MLINFVYKGTHVAIDPLEVVYVEAFNGVEHDGNDAVFHSIIGFKSKECKVVDGVSRVVAARISLAQNEAELEKENLVKLFAGMMNMKGQDDRLNF